MAEKKIKIAIIGTGRIARIHVMKLKLMEDVEIVALADIIEGKAETFAKENELEGCRIYGSDLELLQKEKGLDAVSICTYNTTHASCAIHALEAGVNVMLEKPFTVTVDEAIEVMRAERKSGKLLTIGFQPRTSKNMQKIKEIVESGELGEIYYMQSGGGRRRGIPERDDSSFLEKDTAGVGAVGDIGCYSLDMLLNAVGYPKPLTVSGYTSDFFGKDKNYYKEHPEFAKLFNVDDFAAGFVRLEGGIILDFRISWAMHMDTAGDALILGTKGGLRIPSTECWNGEFDKPLKIYKTVDGQTTEHEVPLEEKSDFFFNKIRLFIDAIKSGSPAPIPSGEILYNQAIIEGIVESSRLGKEINIEIPEI